MDSTRYELDFIRRVERSLGVLRAVVGLAACILVITERDSHLAWEWWIETPGWALYSLIGVATVLLLRHEPSAQRVHAVRRAALASDALFLLVQPALHMSDGSSIGLSPVLLFPVLVAARYAIRGAVAGTAGLAAALLATDQFSRQLNGWGLDPDGAVVVLLISLSAAVVGGALTKAAAVGRALADAEASRARAEAARAERATATVQGVHRVLSSGIAAGVHAACASMATQIQAVLDAERVTIRLHPEHDVEGAARPVEIASGKATEAAYAGEAAITAGEWSLGTLVVLSEAEVDPDELQLLADQVGLAAHAARLLDEEASLASRYRDLDRLRSDFLALAAHELRTPTTAIHGALSTIAERGDDLTPDVVRQLLDAAERQAGRLVRLADDLLTIGRSESGAIPLRRQIASVDAITLAAVEELDEGGHVHLVGGAACQVDVDPDRTRQILTNLLRNAVKHGTPPVSVSWRRGMDDVAIRVTDLGAIPPEDRGRVFERFYVGAVSNHTQGSGLGLPLARELAEAMGGTLDLDPAATTTTFVLTLPLARRPTGGDGGGAAATAEGRPD